MEETNDEAFNWDTLISLAQQLTDLGTSIKEGKATSDVTK